MMWNNYILALVGKKKHSFAVLPTNGYLWHGARSPGAGIFGDDAPMWNQGFQWLVPLHRLCKAGQSTCTSRMKGLERYWRWQFHYYLPSFGPQSHRFTLTRSHPINLKFKHTYNLLYSHLALRSPCLPGSLPMKQGILVVRKHFGGCYPSR